MRRLSILGVLLWCCCGMGLDSVWAAQPEETVQLFEAREFKSSAGTALPYRLLKPADYDEEQNKDKKYPLVMFYHGAGERGQDNRKQLVHGMADFASNEIRTRYPCFVVAPQCPADQQWVDVPWTADDHRMPAEPTGALRDSLELLTGLEQVLRVDPDRIYLTGLSMGGFGVWDALQRQPRRFAAAVPICGGGDKLLAPSIAHVPVWCFHGGADTVVKPQRSRDMVEALRAAGAEPRYTEYVDGGHNSWSATYHNPEMYAWLFRQHR